MLQNLRIKNFALIEDLEMTCTAGLNVLTGETGAGKSILIDALNILLGEKAGAGFIRFGCEKAIIEGIFQIKSVVINWLKTNELIDEEPIEEAATELIVSREIAKAGSRFRINGVLVNQATMAELKPMLIHMHAQHEARTLLGALSQLNILDALASGKHQEMLAEIKALHLEKTTLQKELEQMQMSEEERVRRLDFAHFHLEELRTANLKEADEDEQLAKRQAVLTNVSQLDLASTNAYYALIGGSSETAEESSGINTGAIDAIHCALANLDKASKLDSNLDTVTEALNNALGLLEDAQTALRHYKDNLESDPEAIQEIEARIAQLATIKRKYGPTLGQAIERTSLLENEIEQLENAQQETNKIQNKIETISVQQNKKAMQIREERKKLAQDLAVKVKTELSALGMERCQFEIAFEKNTDIGPYGFDRVEFMISPNPGQALLPLAKIASGGELSRIMLALKSIVAGLDDPPTIVFDEIDAGLSGRIVQAVRDKLVNLSQVRQVLCITHQPIIAAAANNHLFIEKQHQDQSTNVTICALSGQDRVKALAAMASGRENEAVALDFAQALLNQQYSSDPDYRAS